MGNVLKKYNGTNWDIVGGAVTGDTLPIGAMIPYTSKTTPLNWLPCNGQAISRTDYADLFAIIGTQYGEGDGSTTFNVPDLNDYKVPIGYDRFEEQSSRMNLGTTGGEEKHTLTVDEMPTHNHTVSYLKQSAGNDYQFAGGVGSWQTTGIENNNINYTGGSQPHNNMQPYVTTNYIIKAFQSSGVVAEVVNEKTESTTDTYSCDYINLQLDNKIDNDKIIIEQVTIATNDTFVSNDGKTYSTPVKEGYTGYVIKPIVAGDWADKNAVYVPFNTANNFGIRNISSTDYTWSVYCVMMYVKN